MVTNNLFIRLKERSKDNIEEAKDKLLSMKGKIETLRDLRVEVDLRKGNYDLMLITQYDSLEGLEAYLVHPIHIEVSNYLVSILEDQASLCYESL